MIKAASFSRKRLIVFALVFGLVGGYVLLHSFAAPNPNLPGDLNGDNTVNVSDLSTLLSFYGTNNAAADINKDGIVNILDLSILLAHYGQSVSAALPSIPTGLVATPGNGSVTLNWSANPSSDQVDVYQVYLNDANYNMTVNGTSLTITGLTNGTNYNFRVSAHNAAGYGNWTNSVSATPTSGTPPPPPPSGGSGFTNGGIGVDRDGPGLTAGQGYNRYDMVIMNPGYSTNGLPVPKKVLIYVTIEAESNYNDGIDWNVANSNGWLLKDASGNYIKVKGYPNSYLTDRANPAFQTAWANAVINLVKNSSGANGIFIDNLRKDMGSLENNSSTSSIANPAYSTVAQRVQASVNFFAAVYPKLHAAGIYTVANMSGYPDPQYETGAADLAWDNQLAPSLDGIFTEFYQVAGNGAGTIRHYGSASYPGYWEGWQKIPAAIQALGKDWIGMPTASSVLVGDVPQIIYARASQLLEDQGRSILMPYAVTSISDAWGPIWTKNMGAPLGPKFQAGNAWKRNFANGTVTVDPVAGTASIQ